MIGTDSCYAHVILSTMTRDPEGTSQFQQELTREMASTPQSVKAKGRRFQKSVMNTILDVFGDVLEDDDVRWTSMGSGGEDILLSPLAQKVFPFATECKNVERINIWKALEQAFDHETEKRPGIVCFKRNYSDDFVALRLEDFMSILRRLAELSPSINTTQTGEST